MKINHLKINGYGKIIDKKIDLKDNINIIHGENESGKSTVLSFINSMFYGASKNKNGKNISEFEKYKPWQTENFSGKIKYTLDDNNTFEVYREFKKKNPIIYDKNLSDISNNFSADKTNGINFLSEQIGMDEETFKNTVLTYQDGIKVGKLEQNSIIQKISNLVSSGDETVSFNKTIRKINELQNEQVGTSRTTQRPINLLENRIKNLEKNKAELESYKNSDSQNEKELFDLKNEIDNELLKLELLKKYKEENDKNNVYFAEINANKELENSYKNKLEELNKKIEESEKERENKEKEYKKEKKNFIKKCIIMIVFLCILNGILIYALDLVIAAPILLLVDIVVIILIVKNRLSFNKKQKSKIEDIEEFEKKVKQEMEIMQKNLEEIQDQTILKERDFDNYRDEKINEITDEYISKLDRDFIETVFDMNYDEISVSVSTKEEVIKKLTLNQYAKENEKQYMNDKMENLAKIQEELENAYDEKKELEFLNNSFNIAKECMEAAYEEIRESLSPVFTSELCSLASKISNNKYKKIKFSDEDGLTIQIEDGRYISVENLSIGTIDQMYLSLRLSALKTISAENMPIILDEAFAYFDDKRLKNIFSFITENYNNKQVIIFTCSNREKEILDKLQLEYNLINL